jgi:parallel beta-helix repeat protein
MGINAGTGSTILGCTAVSNQGDGIHVNGSSLVRECNSITNGLSGDGAGIRANNGNNRIEANNVTGNDRGIDVPSGGNLIIQNSASDNTKNFLLASKNVFGVIVDRSAPSSVGVNGNAAASSAGTTDPWANISY